MLGGGIAGLAAAWELTGGARADPSAPHVVLLEASPVLGGALRSTTFGSRPVDLGPDGFLARRPEATTLCHELGLDDQLVPVGARGAAVWVRGRRRMLPAGLVLGVPTRVGPVARSGILGARGTARLALDRAFPRPDRRGPLEDRAVGPLVGRKLGRRVVDQLVDPLVGGIHAGGVADMSTAAVFPLLLTAAQRRGSFLRSLRLAAAEAEAAAAPVPEGRPAFWALRDGMATLPARLEAELCRRGVEVRTDAAAHRLSRTGQGAPGGGGDGAGGLRDGGSRTGGSEATGRWVVAHQRGEVVANGLVLATPAPITAALLEPYAEEAARILRAMDYASVGVLTFAFPTDAVPDGLEGTGLLVPRTARPPAGRLGRGSRRGDPFLTTACTYLSQKWPHLAQPDVALIRVSVGRLDDERAEALDDGALTERVLTELNVLLGVDAPPVMRLVTRWPRAFPQYRVHHLLRVAAVESATARLPAVAVAGAPYHGIGIPACVGSGRQAARHVLQSLGKNPP